MTAEIVVMNTGGIALASDSAVTIGRKKVYHSANKLFGFSERHTVGMMTYGSASMLDVPWDTLIKVYKNTLGADPFETVEQYKEDFLQFLNKNEYDQFMSEVNEERYIKSTLYANVIDLYEELSHMNKNLYSEHGELRLQDEIQEMYVHMVGEFLHNRRIKLKEKKFPKGFNQSDYEPLLEKYGIIIEELIYKEFENHLFIEEWMEKVKYILIQSLVKDFSENYSGIVFAGYGSKEIFPAVHLIIIDGKVNDKTKYFTRKRTINHSTHAVILPFAQRDMIRSFLDGIHKDVEGFVSTVLQKELHLLSDTLIHKLTDRLNDAVDLELVKSEISDTIMRVYSRYQKKLDDYKRENFIEPILEVVKALPTRELAHMAESLLNIASLERKMSIAMETVGGPIDVAVITKGDGFKWIKKK